MASKIPELIGAISVIVFMIFSGIAIHASGSAASWIVLAIIAVFAVPTFISLATEPREAPKL